jgi:hypothetical protein
MVYLINISHRSVCLYVYVARQRLSKNLTVAMNTHTLTEELLDTFFLCGPHCIKEESVVLSVYPLSLLSNGLVNTFLQQRRITGGTVFYVVHVMSKESMQLVLPRTSCCNLKLLLLFESPSQKFKPYLK